MNGKPFRGKHVRFKASVRFRGKGRAQLWMRVDREGRRPGFFDNMSDRPIQQREWREYQIIGKVAGDAKGITVGLMVIGGGTAHLDGASLEIVATKDLPRFEGPRKLSEPGLQNVAAFIRLMGYVRYFHPSDEAKDVDWDQFAVRGIRKVEAAKTPAELATTLQELFAPVAPTVRVSYPDRPRLPAKLRERPQGTRLTAWKHVGIGHNKRTAQIYRSRRVKRTKLEGHASPTEPFIALLPGKVHCLVPLTLYVDGKGTLPRATKQLPNARPQRLSADDRATRLAAIGKAWNIFQHFYPYHDVVQTGWDNALRPALARAATDKDLGAFLETLRTLVAQLQDGHGHVGHPRDPNIGVLPVLFTWVEEELVVLRASRGCGLRRGDVVTDLDGKTPKKRLEEIGREVSASTAGFRTYRSLQQLRRGPVDEEITVTVKGAKGEERTVVLSHGTAGRGLTEKRPQKIQRLEKGIYYIDINRVNDDDLRKAKEQLATAKGLIYDFRGYPRGLSPQMLFGNLIQKRCTSARWILPHVRYPDRKHFELKPTLGRWTLLPKKPYFEAKRAFLVDGRAISYAESCMGIVEHYQLGAIVGVEPTAGTNGNVNPFRLPGGFQVSWTGMMVKKHDGSEHHGVGIAPTVKVVRTVQGVRDGRDEVLQKALEVVR